MLVRKLFRTAWSYKSQFLSMILMIAIGIGVFTGFHMEWHSIESNTSTFFEETKYADYRLYSSRGFSEKEREKVQEIDGVDAVSRYLSVSVGLKDTKQSVTLNVSDNYEVSTMLVTEGAPYDENGDGIWLSDRFASANGIEIGDSMTMEYQGFKLAGEVVGLCKSSENMICVADENQLMPDFTMHGFAYISPKKLKSCIGITFYPQMNIISDLPKAELEETIKGVVGRTIQITDKEMHTPYAGAQSEVQEGKAMGSVLPVLFLAIAVLTMVTTMHRIAANEKVQIGTLKALGFRDRKILRHYTSYGLVIGLAGSVLGTILGYGIARFIISPHGMMSTYLDLPQWRITMPSFVIPVLILTIAFLTGISYLSTKKMLEGTAADALRPYVPKAMKKSRVEKLRFWQNRSFAAKWNLRDILRHKARSGMTLLGVFGCMLLMVGGLGMKDTVEKFLEILNTEVSNYETKLNLSESAKKQEALELCSKVDGDWQSSSGVSLNGNTIVLDIYSLEHDKIRFLTEKNTRMKLEDDGVYLCLRLKNTAKIGDVITFSPYGSEETYQATVAGYYRSLFSESIAMTQAYADQHGIDYQINTIYTNMDADAVPTSGIIAGKQEKHAIMETYDTMMEMMDLMVAILIAAAMVLGIVVLYNLGVMSYVERRRELATLKVLGFRDQAVGRLLISQNLWLTMLGIVLGIPGGLAVLQVLIKVLASEYELSVYIGALTYSVSTILTLGVSLLVGWMVVRKCRTIDMVEALKGAE